MFGWLVHGPLYRQLIVGLVLLQAILMLLLEGTAYMVASLLASTLFASWIGTRITRRLSNLVEVAGSARSGVHGVRAVVDYPDEIGQVARDFNAMLGALEERESAIEASHETLKIRQEHFDLALKGANDGVWDWDLATGKVFYSPQWKAMIGYAEHEIGDSSEEWKSRIHPDDLPATLNALQDHLDNKSPIYETTFRLRHNAGHCVWVLSRGVATRDAEGKAYRIAGTHVDITARKRLEKELQQAQRQLAAERDRALVTLAAIEDGVLVTDAHGHITYMNDVAQQLSGWSLEDAIGVNAGEVAMLLDEETKLAMPMQPVALCRMSKTVLKSERPALLSSPGRRSVPVEHTVSPIINTDGKFVGMTMILHDITQSRDLATTLTWQATHDTLTGLWSRGEFERRLNKMIGDAQLRQTSHALLYLDLDQFKVVNDTCGHAAGDELLKQLTFLLQKEIRHTDTLARLGGDEFGVLLADCPLDKAKDIGETFRGIVRDFRFSWEGRSFAIGVSIGLVGIDASVENQNDALRQADMACYAAKDMGRNRIHVYEADDAELSRRHSEMQWASRINEALTKNGFRLYAQEIRPLGEDKHAHFEILLRMIDESGKEIPPGAFIPAAERYNLMDKIDKWVIEHTLKALDASNCRLGEIRLAINLSALSLMDGNLPNFLHEQLHRNRISPEALCFEITETAAITHLSTAVHFIQELKQLGCKFALDDFGSGMSSFAYLKNLPVDYLKIDGSFVRDIETDPIDRAFVETINRIGKVMGKETIAEFVENPQIMKLLEELGVDYVQGYGVSKPLPLANWLDTISFSEVARHHAA